MKSFLAIALMMICTAVRADDHIVIVFDTSGSMENTMRGVGKTRMAVAKQCLKDVLGKLPATTKVGILTFAGWAYELGTIDKAKMTAAINNCRSDGSTPLYAHIKQGGTRLLQERARQNNIGSYKLIVVTDGAADNDDALLNNDSKWNDGLPKPGVIRDILNRGITIDTIGLEIGGDHALAKQINGSYMRGDDPSSLTQGLAKAVAEVGFNGKDAASEEFFNELNGMPEVFVKATIQGLTDLPNHPIGERAPIKVVHEDGTITEQENPDQPGGSYRGLWVAIIIISGSLTVFFVVRILLGNNFKI